MNKHDLKTYKPSKWEHKDKIKDVNEGLNEKSSADEEFDCYFIGSMLFVFACFLLYVISCILLG